MSRLSRRSVLKRSVIAAAPMIIPATALGLQNTLAPSQRIAMGFIGTGGQGTQHIAGGPWTTTGGFLARGDAQVVALCDVETARREGVRQRVNKHYADRMNKGEYKGCDTHFDFRELLARPDLDAVLIATGDRWHALMSIEAMAAGKDVYCEKPITLTIREAQQLREAVRRYARILQVGTQQRSSGAFRRACELVRNGRIGKVLRVHVNVGGTSKLYDAKEEAPPPGFDWDRWLGPAPWRPYSAKLHRAWMAHRDYSGGEMTNWGAHHFDIAQWGLGKDDTGPVEIIPPDGKDVKVLTYRYADGPVIHHGGGANGGVTFIGTEGEVNTDRWFYRPKPERLMKEIIGPHEQHLYVSENHHDNFVECIRTRRPPIAHIDALSRSISLCHLGNIAYWLNRPLKWDPQAEQFVDDDAANRWIDRPKRALEHLKESGMNEATGEQKISVLVALYRAAFDEMTWRRNAGYRTIILGLAYCGALVTAVSAVRGINFNVRMCISAVVLLGSIFGSAYLASNYYKYCDALRRMVKIEEYVGAYAPEFLGALGPLMSPSRKAWPETPLSKNHICIWSIVAFLAGGVVTAIAVLIAKSA